MPDQPPKKLYRSTDNRLIAGVCAGLADFFSIDPTWVRLAFILLLLAAGSTLLIYIVMWIIVPNAPAS